MFGFKSENKIVKCTRQAIRESVDLSFGQKLFYLTALAFPGVQQAIVESVESEPGTKELGDGELLKYIIDKLPEILAAIEFIFKLLG